MEIIPAIIARDITDLEDKMSPFRGVLPLVQVDVLDGSLVSLRSWPYQSPSKPDSFFRGIIMQERGFPLWEDLEFEAHLMVRNPERIASEWISSGASRIIFELEGVGNVEEVFREVAGRVPLGVAIALDTPEENLAKMADRISIIQCMGWNFSHLGKQGEPFDDETFDKVRRLRQKFPKHIISIDGGVNLDNAPKLLAAGAERLVVGSALREGGRLRENLEQFLKLSKNGNSRKNHQRT